MSKIVVREARLRQAIASAKSLSEQRRLTAQLDALRRQAADQKAIDRELDMAAQIVRDTTTPVRVHDRHTAATDWLADIEVPNGDDYDKAMRVEAALWFKKLHTAVKSDRDEFAEQAQGMASRLAGQYGPKAAEAAQAFLQEVARLFRQADMPPAEIDDDQSGNAESQVTDYDTEAGQDPMWSEDWDGEDDTGSQIGSEQPSEQPGSATARRRYPKGSAREGGLSAKQANFTHEERRWYNEGYDRGQDDRADFAAMEGIDPNDFSLTSDDFMGNPLSGEWAGQSIPEIFGSWDAATPEAMDAYEEGYEDGFQGNSRQASKKTAASFTIAGEPFGTGIAKEDSICLVGGEPVDEGQEVFSSPYVEGGEQYYVCRWHGKDIQRGDIDPGSVAISKRKTAKRECPSCGYETMAPGMEFCPKCGDQMELKTSKKTAGVYCKTHDVWVGDENADTHSRDSCKKEQRATEKTKDARKQASEDEDEAPEIDDDDSDEVNDATNEFAEEVAEELAETSEESENDSEPVDNEGDGEVSSEDDKEAKLAKFRAKVKANLK